VRKLGCGILLLVCAAVGAWVGLVLWGRTLPDAPHTASSRVAGSGATPTVMATDGVVAVPDGAPLAIPVAGVARSAIADSWGDPRQNGLRAHHGTDIMAPSGTLVTAAAPGTVEKLWNSVAGGTTIYVRSPQRNWTYYYAHLSGYAPGLHEGQVVKTGDPLGYVGDTGDAGAGNFHLHFGLSRTNPDQHWYQGEDVNPYPYLAGKPSSR